MDPHRSGKEDNGSFWVQETGEGRKGARERVKGVDGLSAIIFGLLCLFPLHLRHELDHLNGVFRIKGKRSILVMKNVDRQPAHLDVYGENIALRNLTGKLLPALLNE